MKKFMSILAACMLVLIIVTLAFAATVSVTNKGDIATGTITADGAAVNVSLGYTPSSVMITKATTTFAQAYWVTGMASGSCLKSTGTGTTATETTALIVSLPTVSCISTYAGSTSAAPGFSLGADLDLNIPANTLRFEAHR